MHFATECRSLGSESVLEAGLPDCPLVDHVGPILEHRPALIAVLGLVVDGTNALLFVRKALLDPVGVIARLMQQRAGCAPQVVRSKLAK